MTIIDRYILNRLLWNFLLLFLLLYLFAVGIDVILNLDEYMRAARERVGDGTLARFGMLLRLMLDFQGPRLFQFFAYMNGMVIVGAMGFTLANMHRNRELLALLASGISLQRIAVPFLAGTFLVSVLQLLNQEFVMHRIAPMLLRGTTDIGRRSVRQFPVKFIRGERGELLHAASFDPADGTLRNLAVLERDAEGRTTRRITAVSAEWDGDRGGWTLHEGEAVSLAGPEQEAATASRREPISFYETELDPKVITFRRYGEFASMLSLRQIEEMLSSPQVSDVRTLLRHRYARFAAVFVTLLVMCISLPSFLLREPASIMRQSLICAAMSLPFMMGAAIGMTVDLPGLAPAVSVFLPVILLIPVAMGRWTFLKT